MPVRPDLMAIAKRRRERKARSQNLDRIRERCKSLSGFVAEGWHVLEGNAKFVPGWHIDAICEHLEAVTAGEIRRFLANVPPGAMKSLLCSVFWPAWEWGPKGLATMRYLTTSYEGKLAMRDNVRMRRLVQSEWYRDLWPDVELASDQRAKTKFENTAFGGRECRAFESMTGGRGDRVIIDDPHSVDSSESELQRDGAVQTFRESITDRLNDPEASAIVIIMQRLHSDDISGTIQQLGMDYCHLEIPMEFERARRCVTSIGWTDPRKREGELMCPERWSRDTIEQTKRDKGDYAYAGQYQQRPAPREGGMFKVDLITIVEHAPAGGDHVRGWDIAGSVKKKSPYTAGGSLKRMPNGDIYITDMKRKRAKIGAAEAMIVETSFEDGLAIEPSIPQDPGSAGLSQKNTLAGQMAGLKFHFSTETGSKEDRAIPLASQVEAGKVYMVRGDWNAELIEEMRNFPNSSFKDQVDALSRAFARVASRARRAHGLAGPKIGRRD